MTKHHDSTATATSRTKRFTMGAASVLTAGALLATGVQGVSATTLSDAPATRSTGSVSAQGLSLAPGALIHLLQRELRADLREGQSPAEDAQNVAETVIGHPRLFASLPANLQADTIALRDASPTDRAAAATIIGATALADGYGDQAKTIAAAIRDNPERPLYAAMRAILNGAAGGASGALFDDAVQAGPSIDGLAKRLTSNPLIFATLPAALQTNLTAMQNTPAGAARTAAGQKIAADAAEGVYGPRIQTLVGQFRGTQAAEADAALTTETGE